MGDGKRASREPRALLVAPGEVSRGPLPPGPRAEGACAAALEAVGRGAQPRPPVFRERPEGKAEWSAAGEEDPGPRSPAVGGAVESGTARRLVVRAVRQAPAAAAARRARVAKARAQREARHDRGRGNKRREAVAVGRQAVGAMGQREGVEDLGGCRWTPHPAPRPVRPSRGRPARREAARQATVEVGVAAVAVAAAGRRWGGRGSGTHPPRESWALEPAVLASRRAERVERSVGRLPGRPRSLTPMDGPREDHATGRVRLWSIAWRVWTRLAGVGRRPLATEGATRAGL